MKILIGLWVLKGWEFGGKDHPKYYYQKPLFVKRFILYRNLVEYKYSVSEEMRGKYPEYCITVDKIFGNTISY